MKYADISLVAIKGLEKLTLKCIVVIKPNNLARPKLKYISIFYIVEVEAKP